MQTLNEQLTAVADLIPHPRNQEIYGNEEISELAERIDKSGWIKALVVNPANKRVISGHRRLAAAQQLGRTHVPVEWRTFTDETEELEALLLENASRDKTPEQKVREAEVWEEIEGERARARQIALAGTRPNAKSDLAPNLAQGTEPAAPPVRQNSDEQGQGRSADKAAARVGMKKSTYKKSKKVVKTADKLRAEGKSEVAEKLLDTLNNKSVDAAARELQEYEKRQQAEQAREETAAAAEELPQTERLTLLLGDFRDCIGGLADNSVDLIFTDPPYDAESIPLYTDLAEHAARVLKPGGSLIAYAGHYALPQILAGMTSFLRFWWLCAVQHTGGNRRFPGKWVYVGWKPLVWFVKEGRRDNEFVSDIVRSELENKHLHDWQQGVSEALYYIERLTGENDVVLDPFAGSGTTLAAALHLNRQAIGIEQDAKRLAVAKGRLSESIRATHIA